MIGWGDADALLEDGRHSILAVIDLYTRRAQLHVSKTSRAAAVAHVTQKALLAWGVPAIAKTDNGQDYVSNQINRIFYYVTEKSGAETVPARGTAAPSAIPPRPKGRGLSRRRLMKKPRSVPGFVVFVVNLETYAAVACPWYLTNTGQFICFPLQLYSLAPVTAPPVPH